MDVRAVGLLLLVAGLAGCVQVSVGEEPPTAEAIPSTDDGVTTLRLTVVDAASGSAVPEAEVRLSVPGLGGITKATDAEGQATFHLQPAPTCNAAISRSGYTPRTVALECDEDRGYRVQLTRTTAPASPSGPRPSGSASTTTTTPAGGAGGNGTDPDGNATGNDTAPRPFEPEEPSGTCGSLDSLTPVAPDATLAPGLALGWPLLEVTVAVIVDPAFVEAHPDDWRELIRDLVADSSALFEEQVGVRLNLTLVDRLPDGSLAPGSGDDRQRAVARGYMGANHPDADADIVAVILGADYNGSTAGQVECVHGAGYEGYNYLWAEYDGSRDPLAFGPVGVFDDTPLKVFTHETGHLFAAHHHYSNCGEALAYFSPSDAMALCDVMINDIGLASFHFGPMNRLVMRSYVEQIGIGTPV